MKGKIAFLVTEDWFFCSHFIARAIATKQAGYDVVVMARANEHAEKIREAGLRFVAIDFDRRSTNPLKEMALIAQIAKAYRVEKPDLVHQVALKPILYGTIAALMTGVRRIVNAPVGMGYIFSSGDLKARLLRFPVKFLMRILLNPRGSKVIFENGDDQASLIADGFVKEKDAVLIRGAGIDLSLFSPTSEPAGIPAVILTARMLWDKGIAEFVEAARILRKRGSKARFLLVGAPDPLNHAAVPEDFLKTAEGEGLVEYLGHRSDIPALLASSHIVCLPSYREGLPKSLLEALAASRPIVTTDVSGCRETVQHRVNGLLVPSKDSTALANALETLLSSPQKRIEMGKAGRQMAEKFFSQEQVISETLAVYDKMMAGL